jgi:hypothetical protein
VNSAKEGKNRQHPIFTAMASTSTPKLRVCCRWVPLVLTSGRQGTEPFEVLADPEGNEFCLLRIHPATA